MRSADDQAITAAGAELGAIAAAQTETGVFDPLAFAQAAALLEPLLPAPPAATDALARLLGISLRLAEDWLRETLTLLRDGDQEHAAVRDTGTRRIGILALAWRA